MHNHILTSIILACTVTASVLDYLPPRETGNPSSLSSSTITGALNHQPTDPAVLEERPYRAGGPLTININNRMGTPLSIQYRSNAGAPSPSGINQSPATLVGSTMLVYPSGWAGNIVLGPNFDVAGSKIEAELTTSDPPVVDVSYVDGYSVPITCSCNNVAVTGCNKDLFSLNSCPDPAPGPVCHNPEQNELTGNTAAPFFAPCRGSAYTYPTDNNAVSNSPCSNNVIDCCVGTICMAPARQPGGPGANASSVTMRRHSRGLPHYLPVGMKKKF